MCKCIGRQRLTSGVLFVCLFVVMYTHPPPIALHLVLETGSLSWNLEFTNLARLASH